MSLKKILIVEDESIVAMELADRLGALGYDVVGTAATGSGAIEKAISEEPDLVLMDIMLKGDMTGIEAAEKIKLKKKIPIVFLTAYADENTLERAKITEPYGYLLKPFEERELHTTIEIALYKDQSEKKLLESEKRLSTTLKSLGEAVLSTDEYGIIDFLNPTAEKLTGYKSEEAKGCNVEAVFNLLDEDSMEKKANPITKVLRSGGIVKSSNNSLLISKSNTPIPVNYNASPIKDDDENISGVVLVFRDISERRRSEKLLAESENRFRTLYENASIGIYRTTPNGEIILANPSLIKMLGFDNIDELKRRGVDAGYSSEEDRIKYKYLVEQQNFIIGYEQIWKKKNGDEIIVRESSRAVKDEDGKIICYEGTVEDFTDQKRMEQDLIEAKNRAEASDKIKSEFLATMSHEIRTPINTILNFISLIKEDVYGKVTEDIKHSFDIIDSGSRRLIRTIDSILNMSNLQAGSYDLKPENLNIVNDVLENLISEFQHAAELKGLFLQLCSNNNVPNLILDRYSITQLLANLIDNAIKYTNEGGITVSVESTGENLLKVFVTDSGIGMTDDFIKIIFNPFTQEDTGYTRKFEGSGLGLALVHNYALLNNADIDVFSKKGKGSVFVVKLCGIEE